MTRIVITYKKISLQVEKDVDFKFSPHDVFLEHPSSGKSKPKYLKDKKCKSLWEQENKKA